MSRRYYITRTPLFALQPINELRDSRQVKRRKVITQLKHRYHKWSKTGMPSHPKGPTPRRPARPKVHRWLESFRHE